MVQNFTICLQAIIYCSTMKALSTVSLANINRPSSSSEIISNSNSLTNDISRNKPATYEYDDGQYELDLVKMLLDKSSKTKLVRPHSPNDNGTLVIRARLYFIRIQSIVEASECLHSTFRLQLMWQDPSLIWSPEDYGGRKDVVVPGGKLWVPDLQIANSLDFSEDFLGDKRSFPFRVTSNGNIWYHPTGMAKTRCKFDLTFYPFDLQYCLIIIESVVFQENELRIVTRSDEQSNPISLGMFAENEVWEIVHNHYGGHSTVFRSGRRTAFSRVHFWMVMRRKPAFFTITAVIPSIILGVITLLTYLVPIHYVERPVQSVTTVLTVAIFEVMVAEKLPDNSANCLLTIYLTVILCSSAITILTTTVCLAIVDPGQYISAPWGIPNLINGLCHLCGCKSEPIDIELVMFNRGRRRAAVSDQNGPYRPINQGQRPSVSGAKVVTEERHLSTSKTAWYISYAINWIGFFVCLMTILSIPVYAWVKRPVDISHGNAEYLHADNETLSTVAAYYGDQ